MYRLSPVSFPLGAADSGTVGLGAVGEDCEADGSYALQCKLYWQNQGDFLCVKVDRHTKTKKSTFCNLEIFRVREKDFPVEVVELKGAFTLLIRSSLSFVLTPRAFARGAGAAVFTYCYVLPENKYLLYFVGRQRVRFLVGAQGRAVRDSLDKRSELWQSWARHHHQNRRQLLPA